MGRKRNDGQPRTLASNYVPMTKSGHCQFPSPSSHKFCTMGTCTCECHKEEEF